MCLSLISCLFFILQQNFLIYRSVNYNFKVPHFLFVLGAFIHLSLEERLLIPSHMSICPSVHFSAFIKSVATGCIFMNFDIGNVYENLSRKSTFAENRTNISGTFQT